MYLDPNTICTLEYHYIQSDCTYTELLPIKEKLKNDKFVDDDDNPHEYKLATHSYEPSDEKHHPMSIFPKSGITNFGHGHDDLFKSMWELEDRGGLMLARYPESQLGKKDMRSQPPKKIVARGGFSPDKGEKKQEPFAIVQPFIGIYKITAEGRMSRQNEIPVNMGRRNFFAAKDGNMQLTRSKDKRSITIVNFDPKDVDKNYFKLCCWDIKNAE